MTSGHDRMRIKLGIPAMPVQTVQPSADQACASGAWFRDDTSEFWE